MSEIYEITLEKEVLREMAAGIHAKYVNHMLSTGISRADESNPVVIMEKDVWRLKEAIIPDFSSLDELKIVEGRLKQLNYFIEKVSENSADKNIS